MAILTKVKGYRYKSEHSYIGKDLVFPSQESVLYIYKMEKIYNLLSDELLEDLELGRLQQLYLLMMDILDTKVEDLE